MIAKALCVKRRRPPLPSRWGDAAPQAQLPWPGGRRLAELALAVDDLAALGTASAHGRSLDAPFAARSRSSGLSRGAGIGPPRAKTRVRAPSQRER